MLRSAVESLTLGKGKGVAVGIGTVGEGADPGVGTDGGGGLLIAAVKSHVSSELYSSSG